MTGQFALMLGVALGGVAQAQASDQAVAPDAWRVEKCNRYSAAWAYVQGPRQPGIGADFLRDHDAFLASGCQSGRVCPASAAEMALADTLSMIAVAEGMAGSFLPFGCP